MINEFSQPPTPINELPPDILFEIFSRCVDQSSASVLMQPNTKIAPMSLCQVCATWRAIVLSTPSFWSHLRFELPITWHSNGRPFTWDPEAFTHRLEWLRWWRRNLGLMAPYLQIELRRNHNPNYRRGRLSDSTSEFLLEFMSSAQYLSVGRLYRYLVQRRTEAGYVVRAHPNAHTVVIIAPAFEYDDSGPFNQYLTAMLAHTCSTLRYLVIENIPLRPQEFANPPQKWSTLTHLSMGLMSIDLAVWFSFIRSLTALQAGSFYLSLVDDDIDDYAHPPIATLQDLSLLYVSAAHGRRISGQYPLKAVFDNLRLPTLRTLSLESRSIMGYDSTAIIDVHAALLSAPALTKLSFGVSNLGPQMYTPIPEYFRPETIRSDVEPLATYAPQLQHLKFVVWSPLRQRAPLDFITRVFASSNWLGLKNPTSTIRKVTLVSSRTLKPDDLTADLVNRRQLISEVRRFVHDETAVGFEDEKPVEVRRAVWGW